jgi:hypothetical protein
MRSNIAPDLQYTARQKVSLTDGKVVGTIQAVLLYGDMGKASKSPCSEICHSASEIRQMASEIMLTHNEIFANAKVIRNNINKIGDQNGRLFYVRKKLGGTYKKKFLIAIDKLA